MDVTTVVSRHAAAVESGDQVEVDLCMTYMLEHFLELDQSHKITQLDRVTLETLVRSDRLQADELGVLRACLTWARHRVTDPGSTAALRTELGDILYRIRLPVMSLENFSCLMTSDLGSVLSSDEKLMLIGFIRNRSGCKQIKFDNRIRLATTSLPSYSNETVVNRFKGPAVPPFDKENSNNNNNNNRKSTDQVSSRAKRSNIYLARYDYNWLSGSLNRFKEPVQSGFNMDAIDIELDQDIHITALGLYAGPRPSRQSNKPTNQNKDKKLTDSDKPRPTSDCASQSAHSVVIEIHEAGLINTPTRQHKSYHGFDGQLDQPIRVELREPVLIRGGARYTILVKSTGALTYRGTEGRDEVIVVVPNKHKSVVSKDVGVAGRDVGVSNTDKGVASSSEGLVRFRFFKSSRDFSGTDPSKGQIPQIYFTI